MNESVKPILNAEIAKNNILVFNNQVKTTCSKLSKALNNFSTCLANNWFSTKAVEFSNVYSSLTQEISDTVAKIIKDTDDGACNNYNYVANKEGLEQISVNDSFSLDLNTNSFLVQSPNGRVGMNISFVKVGLEELTSVSNEVISSLSSMSSYILLYKDTLGNKKYYYVRSDEIVQTIKSVTDKIVRSITAYINEEIDTLSNAQKMAIDNLTQK
jgi:hypothetical protein